MLHNGGMSSELQSINQEIERINAKIDSLAEKRKRLSDMRSHLPMSGPSKVAYRLNKKTERKLEVLSFVASILGERRFLHMGGAESRELYDILLRQMPNLKYSTFRSYMTRFKDDGRLGYDKVNRRWTKRPGKEW